MSNVENFSSHQKNILGHILRVSTDAKLPNENSIREKIINDSVEILLDDDNKNEYLCCKDCIFWIEENEQCNHRGQFANKSVKHGALQLIIVSYGIVH